MAHTFPENIDEVDVISDAEVIVWNYIVIIRCMLVLCHLNTALLFLMGYLQYQTSHLVSFYFF